jgi:hypothetical protein
MEKEKWFESMKIRDSSDLHRLRSDKEKEISALQE